jgi:short-subunit dehydrogenase
MLAQPCIRHQTSRNDLHRQKDLPLRESGSNWPGVRQERFDLLIAANESELESAADELRREGGTVDTV